MEFWISAALSLLGGVFFHVGAISWVSEPAMPGDWLIIFGSGLGDQRQAAMGRLPDGDEPKMGGSRIVGLLSRGGRSAFCRLPKDIEFGEGIFSLGIGAETVLVNLPRPRWAQALPLAPGIGKNEGTPGGNLQILGRNFLLKESDRSRVAVVLQRGSQRVPVAVREVEPFSLVVSVPPALSEGNWELLVHNGHGGSKGWGRPLAIRVKSPEQWPKQVWNARDFGAKGNNQDDDTAAIERGLEKIAETGGGVLWFPKGTYRVSRSLFLPKRTTLRGELDDQTILQWPMSSPGSSEDYLFAGLTGAGDYAIQNITLRMRNVQWAALCDLSFWSYLKAESPGVISFLPSALQGRVPTYGTAGNIFLTKVSIEYMESAGRPSDPGNPAKDMQWKHGFWGLYDNNSVAYFGILMAGVHNVEISRCRILGRIRIVDGQNVRMEDCESSNPWAHSHWVDIGGENWVVERNVLRAGVLTMRGGWEFPVAHVYAAHNWGQVYDGEREGLALDGIGQPYSRRHPFTAESWVGHAVRCKGTRIYCESNVPCEKWVGMDMQVLHGTGVTQVRKVVSAGQDGVDGLPYVEVDRPWAIGPDGDSLLLVHMLCQDLVWYGNDFSGTSGFAEIWGFAYDCVIARNHIRESQGSWATGGWLIQWLDNELDAARTFQQGVGPQGTDERTAEGNLPFGLLGVVSSDAFWKSAGNPKGADVSRYEVDRFMGGIVRRNRLRGGYEIYFRKGYWVSDPDSALPAVIEDLAIQDNEIEDTAVGIHIKAGVDRVLLEGNRFNRVNVPLIVVDPNALMGPGSARGGGE